ncbi:MAG: PA14 domain-containing protein, partial [Chloroflexota bacterium]
MAAILLVLVVGLVGAAIPASADPGPGWHGEYYANVNLAGAPVLVRDDASVNFDWGNGSPGPGVPGERFSARWTAYSYFDGGDYVFRATSDDGVRLWVDDLILIDQWHDHPATTYAAPRSVSPGYHSVRLEYYENTGAALIKLWWERAVGPIAPPPAGDWYAQYYNNTWLGGAPALVRNDAAVSFDWGPGSPAAGIVADGFSARWTRTLNFGGGNYTFSATVDDGVRVWVDGALVIGRRYAQARTTHTATIYLVPGNHTVKVEYFEQTGAAVCIVTWSGAAVPPPPPPATTEVIVDNRDGGFTWGGPSSSWYGRNTGFRGHLYWAWNSRTQVYHWGKWTPNLPQAGNWEAYVYIASQYHGSKSARYRISHAGGTTDRVVNQNIYSNQWVSLGTYYLNAGSGGNVYLSDATGETYGTRYLGFDAVKFVLRGGGTVPPPPTPGPGPTPYPGCAISPVLGFGRVWSSYSTVRTKLGCPTEAEKGTWAADEPFQGGLMLWRQDALQVYVLYNNGTWQAFADTWTSAEPETDPGIVPPTGFYQPRRGFGKVWRNNVP